MDPRELDLGLRRLADLEEIRTLKTMYCHWSDRGYDGAGDRPDRVAELFTEDGAWGDSRGRDAICALFEGFRASLPFSFHAATNPQIEIEGDAARGRWRGLIDLVAADGHATRIVGTYADEFQRTAQGWRFTRVAFSSARRLPAAPPASSAQ